MFYFLLLILLLELIRLEFRFLGVSRWSWLCLGCRFLRFSSNIFFASSRIRLNHWFLGLCRFLRNDLLFSFIIRCHRWSNWHLWLLLWWLRGLRRLFNFNLLGFLLRLLWLLRRLSSRFGLFGCFWLLWSRRFRLFLLRRLSSRLGWFRCFWLLFLLRRRSRDNRWFGCWQRL